MQTFINLRVDKRISLVITQLSPSVARTHGATRTPAAIYAAHVGDDHRSRGCKSDRATISTTDG